MEVSVDIKNSLPVFNHKFMMIDGKSYYVKECDDNFNLKEIIAKIEKDVGKEVELADIGSISKIDLCFVAEVDGEYKYIVKEDDDGNEKFAIADDNSQAARYIVSLKAIELDSCVYTKIDNYNIDEDFNITYLMTAQDEI